MPYRVLTRFTRDSVFTFMNTKRLHVPGGRLMRLPTIQTYQGFTIFRHYRGFPRGPQITLYTASSRGTITTNLLGRPRHTYHIRRVPITSGEGFCHLLCLHGSIPVHHSKVVLLPHPTIRHGDHDTKFLHSFYRFGHVSIHVVRTLTGFCHRKLLGHFYHFFSGFPHRRKVFRRNTTLTIISRLQCQATRVRIRGEG